MTLADHILTDIDAMLDDWDDSVTIASTAYDCLFDRGYVEVADVRGYLPVVTGKTSEIGSVALGTTVYVTSTINNLTSAAFIVRVVQNQGDGTTQLVLEEA